MSRVCFSGFRGIQDGPSHSGNVYCGPINQFSRYIFWEKFRPHVLWPKDEKNQQDRHQQQA